MDAETVADLLTRERRSDAPALADATGRTYDAHWLRTTAWKAGNFLRHAGVRRGVTVGVVGEGPLALLAFLGTALLEGTTRFDPPRDLAAADDLRALVAPVDDVADYDLPPGAQRVGYGGDPPSPDVHHLDAGLWSENPSFPPTAIDPDTPLLADGERTYAHGAVLSTAREVVADAELAAGDRVAVRAPLSDPSTVAAGVIAPIAVDAVIVLADDEADLVISADTAESRRLDPGDVTFA